MNWSCDAAKLCLTTQPPLQTYFRVWLAGWGCSRSYHTTFPNLWFNGACTTILGIWFIPRGGWYGLITWMPLLISLSKIEDGSNTNWYLTQQFDDFVSSTQTALRTPNNSPSRIGDRLYNEYRSSNDRSLLQRHRDCIEYILLPVGLFIMSMEFPSISTYRLAKRLLEALIPKIRSTIWRPMWTYSAFQAQSHCPFRSM